MHKKLSTSEMLNVLNGATEQHYWNPERFLTKKYEDRYIAVYATADLLSCTTELVPFEEVEATGAYWVIGNEARFLLSEHADGEDGRVYVNADLLKSDIQDLYNKSIAENKTTVQLTSEIVDALFVYRESLGTCRRLLSELMDNRKIRFSVKNCTVTFISDEVQQKTINKRATTLYVNDIRNYASEAINMINDLYFKNTRSYITIVRYRKSINELMAFITGVVTVEQAVQHYKDNCNTGYPKRGYSKLNEFKIREIFKKYAELQK